jgi:hypothetical protein
VGHIRVVLNDLDNTVATWRTWLETLHEDLNVVYIDQEIFEALHQAIVDSGTTSGLWANHYQRLYLSKQTMAIRRIVRGKRGEIALTTLLPDIRRRAQELTIDWYRELIATRPGFGPVHIDHFVDSFTSEWCNGGDHLDESIVDADRRTLGVGVASVRDWADTTIAHLLENLQPAALTWGELRASFDSVGMMLNRYEDLLSGRIWFNPPTIAGDWRDPFRKRLID